MVINDINFLGESFRQLLAFRAKINRKRCKYSPAARGSIHENLEWRLGKNFIKSVGIRFFSSDSDHGFISDGKDTPPSKLYLPRT